jgi:hypothetical protein
MVNYTYLHLKSFFTLNDILKNCKKCNLPCLWEEKGEELGVKEDVFNEDIANDSIERKLTRGLYVECGVLVVVTVSFCRKEL